MRAQFLLITNNGLVPITMSFCEDPDEAHQLVVSTSVGHGSAMENDALEFIANLEGAIKQRKVKNQTFQRSGNAAAGFGPRTDQLRIYLRPE